MERLKSALIPSFSKSALAYGGKYSSQNSGSENFCKSSSATPNSLRISTCVLGALFSFSSFFSFLPFVSQVVFLWLIEGNVCCYCIA